MTNILLGKALSELALVLTLLSSTLTAQNVIVVETPQIEADEEINTEATKDAPRAILGANNPILTPAQSIVKALISQVSEEYQISRTQESLIFDLAWLESQLNPLAKNPKSTAKGVFQWLDGSWNALCFGGDVWKAEDNIQCAIRTIKFGGLRHWTIDPNICAGLVEKGHIKQSECAYREIVKK